MRSCSHSYESLDRRLGGHCRSSIRLAPDSFEFHDNDTRRRKLQWCNEVHYEPLAARRKYTLGTVAKGLRDGPPGCKLCGSDCLVADAVSGDDTSVLVYDGNIEILFDRPTPQNRQWCQPLPPSCRRRLCSCDGERGTLIARFVVVYHPIEPCADPSDQHDARYGQNARRGSLSRDCARSQEP